MRTTPPFFFLFLFTPKHAQSEVEETLKRIQSHKGVLGVVIFDKNGVLLLILTLRCRVPSLYAHRVSSRIQCGRSVGFREQ